MLMILLSTPSVIRPMIYEALDWGRKWLVDLNAGKTELVLFDWTNNTGAIAMLFRKNHISRCWG